MQRLFDLVQVRDSKLRSAFFYALGDTLVAEHLDQASRIAYGGNRRWARVVTLQVSKRHPARALPWLYHCCHSIRREERVHVMPRRQHSDFV